MNQLHGILTFPVAMADARESQNADAATTIRVDVYLASMP
jgi:hypothetical protein